MNKLKTLIRVANTIFFPIIIGLCYGAMGIQFGVAGIFGGGIVWIIALLLGVMGYEEQIPASVWVYRIPGYILGSLMIAYSYYNGIYIPLWLVIPTSIIAVLEMSYSAHGRYMRGEQPYQKYDWWPRNPLLFFLIPVYALKAGYNKYIYT